MLKSEQYRYVFKSAISVLLKNTELADVILNKTKLFELQKVNKTSNKTKE